MVSYTEGKKPPFVGNLASSPEKKVLPNVPALKSLDGRTTTRTSGARRWKVSAESSAITSSTVRIPPVNAMVSPPKQRQSAF